MAKTAKQLLAEQNQKKIKSVKKRPKKQQESDNSSKKQATHFDSSLEANPSNPHLRRGSEGTSDEGTKPASKASSPMMRFCNGKSKPYSRKK
jgi:hypothetical protein